MKVLNVSELYLKIFKMVNFMLYMFYHSKKKKEREIMNRLQGGREKVTNKLPKAIGVRGTGTGFHCAERGNPGQS